MSLTSLQSLEVYRSLIEEHLSQYAEKKEDAGIEPPLTEADCSDLIRQVQAEGKSSGAAESPPSHYAAVETVFREIFYELLASTSIEDQSFIQVWNLLDVVSILSDKELCEPGLIFWLVEELLDSQTIDGCRRVFDYLDSRRERITSKHFKQKSLIILRCCNELLRRLSRAEDTVFCGRVFIFLFQSFPLGDKSSVNLRGEFHVENITVFDPQPQKSSDAIKPMELDENDGDNVSINNSGAQAPAGSENGQHQPANGKSQKSGSATDLDQLYPIFWGLQNSFSAPARLFEPNNLTTFKDGITATIDCFQKMGSNASSQNGRQEDLKRGQKRKRSGIGAELSSNFNPKYLTNRDLFDLEVHDVAFRRHILVQTLILLDFLLSLTPSAKAKLTNLTNKSVLYGFTFSDEDASWAVSTKATIASYLQQGSGNEGKFYYRMVDTVLSRDKNWVRWKAENCPSIDRPPVDASQYLDAQRNLQKICTKQTLPPPPGASELDFLSKEIPLESLRDPSRYSLPSMEAFYKGIRNDELDAEMGTEEEMQTARDAKESKLWRALRASKNRFNLCEKIENGKHLEALVGEVEGVSSENVPPTAAEAAEIQEEGEG